MASVRLTNEIRDAIATEVLRHRFGKELAAHVAARAKLADKVYNDLYGRADRKRIDDLPEGWLNTTSEIRFAAGAEHKTVPFNGRFHGRLNDALPPEAKANRIYKRIAEKHRGTCVKVYDANHAIAVASAELDNAFKDIEGRYSEASYSVKAALSKASTTGRLVELWPEMAPFCKKYEAAAPALPSIPTDRLNAILGLPVAEAS